jgi:hypothetical protein
MPKTILADDKAPDTRKAWLVILDVDESVLDKLAKELQLGKSNYFLLKEITMVSDDFTVFYQDIPKLRSEIRVYLSEMHQKLSNDDELFFLCALDGICSACEMTGKNLYGFAD